jgi:hypothetical protein
VEAIADRPTVIMDFKAENREHLEDEDVEPVAALLPEVIAA